LPYTTRFRSHTVVTRPSITNCYKGATRLWRGAAGYGHKPAAVRHTGLARHALGAPAKTREGGPPFAEWPPSPPGRPPSQILCDFRVVWFRTSPAAFAALRAGCN